MAPLLYGYFIYTLLLYQIFAAFLQHQRKNVEFVTTNRFGLIDYSHSFEVACVRAANIIFCDERLAARSHGFRTLYSAMIRIKIIKF